MTKRRLVILSVVALGLVGLWAWASADRCGAWEATPPGLLGVARGQGPLLVGVGKAPLVPAFPVTVGGYRPFRSSASAVNGELAARALVVEVGGVKVAVVSVDTLLVTQPIVDAVRAGHELPIWVVAEHAHSSLGGYDRRLVAQVAALGAFRERDEKAVVTACRGAVDQALASLQPARLEVARGRAQALIVARTGDEADTEVTRLRFLGADGGVPGQWVVASGHPTTVPRGTETLDADWPGRVAAKAEAAGTVTLVSQGAGGNASIDFAVGQKTDDAAAAMAKVVDELAVTSTDADVELGYGSVRVGLPRPDGSRLVPGFLTAAMENLLCDQAEHEAELDVLRLGPVSFLFLPGEAANIAGAVLREQAGTTRVVSNANGYLGYLEHEQAVRSGWGEAAHQYFGPELITGLAQAAKLAGVAAGSAAKAP